MRSKEFVFESKTIKSEKPRNFVAKNAKMGGAGAHKDKKKAVKQGEVKHKKKEVDTMEAKDVSKIERLETLISELEKLMPAVTEAQKNHYVFEEMESEVRAIAEAAKSLNDSSATTDITDAVEEAVERMRQTNAAIYEIERTLKGLIKSANYWLEDARDEEQYEARFGENSDSLEEAKSEQSKLSGATPAPAPNPYLKDIFMRHIDEVKKFVKYEKLDPTGPMYQELYEYFANEIPESVRRSPWRLQLRIEKMIAPYAKFYADQKLMNGQGIEEGKKKGVDGKACWDGYRYAGTENGKDKCVPVKKKK